MRNRVLVYLLLLGLLSISIIFTYNPNRFFQVFQRPDTALAWVGLAIAVVFILRELGKQKIRGIIGILFGIQKADGVIEFMSSGWRYVAVRGGYWIAITVLAFASINLLLGTINEIRMDDTEITHQDIQALIDSNERIIQQMVDSNGELVDRIDRLIVIMEDSNNVPK